MASEQRFAFAAKAFEILPRERTAFVSGFPLLLDIGAIDQL